MESGLKILITGKPGVGKTTCVERLARRLPADHRLGFLTREIRENEQRVGFAIETFDGLRRVLSHVRFSSPYRVGKYGVDVSALEDIIAHLESQALSPSTVMIIDEIGKMESLCSRFRQWMERVLKQSRLLVATISIRGDAWIQSIKQRPDVTLVELTLANREQTCAAVMHQVLQALEQINEKGKLC